MFVINKNDRSKKAWHQPLNYILEQYHFSSSVWQGIVKCGAK
jgi:hypothetical protein